MKLMKHLLTLALLLCLGTFASAQIPSYVPANGLVGWWPFNGNANDESGNGNNGTVNGATLAADRFGNPGKAYSFDGSDDRIDLPLNLNGALLNINKFTLCGFVNRSAGGSINTGIFSNWKDYPLSDPFGIIVGVDSLLGTGNCAGSAVYSRKSVSRQNWIHVSVIFDGTKSLATEKFQLFIDGLKTNVDSTPPTYSSFSAADNLGNEAKFTAFGAWFSQYGWIGHFFGLLDDIAIYNRALTAAEVQQLYLGNSSNTSAASTVPGKIHYQGAAVGANGKPIKNGTVGLRLSVLDSLPNGFNLYTETQSASTDAAGIFSTYLGGGTATAGTFTNIPWANGNNKFLKVEMDAQGGTNYQNMGSSQLVSVPYALHAGSAQRASELVDSAGNAYQIKIVNGQPTLVSAPGNVSIPATFACGQFVNYAGESYPTVQIGSQCWFAKNLNVGTMVLGANDQTNNGTLEKYCYNNDSANCAIYGGLYQWAEAVQYQNGASNTTSPSPAFGGNIKGICPTGWHVPSDMDWSTLEITLGGASVAGGAMKATSGYWMTPNSGASNSSFFYANPSGLRTLNGTFDREQINVYFWESYELGNRIYFRDLGYNNSAVNKYSVVLPNQNFKLGFSVRCLKD